MSDQSFTPPPLKLRPYGGIEMCVPLFLSLLLLLFLGPTSTKPQAEILKLNDVNGCNDISFGDDSILEGDRIPPLKSHGQALEEELCFPGVLSDNRDAPANLLRHFYGCLMPCTCCLDGKRTEDVSYYHTAGIRSLDVFDSCDLDLDPMTFIYELDSYCREIHGMCKYELPMSRLSKVTV